MRWIGDVASTARDKRARCAVPLGRLFAATNGLDDNGYHSDQGAKRSVSDDFCSNCYEIKYGDENFGDLQELTFILLTRHIFTSGFSKFRQYFAPRYL